MAKSRKIINCFLIFVFFLTLMGCVSYKDTGETDIMQKVIEVENMDADAIYDKTLAWCKKEFRSIESNENSSSIDYTSKEEHIISATYIDSVSYLWKDFTQGVNGQKYSFTAETKNGRLRITMQLLEVRQGSTVAGAGTSWTVAGQGHQAKSKSAELFQRLTDSLEKDIKGLNRNDDW